MSDASTKRAERDLERQQREMNEAVRDSSVRHNELTEHAVNSEAARHQSEVQLQFVTDAMPVLIAYVDAEQRYRFVNRTYYDWFGHTPDEIIGKHVRDVVGEAAYSTVFPELERVLSGESLSFERLLPYKDGGSRFVLVNYVPDKDERGKVKGYYALIEDITKRKQTEEAAARLAAIVTSSEDAIISKDLNGIIQSWNEGAQHLFGYSADEIIGKPVTVLIPPNYLYEEAEILERIGKGEVVDHYETVRQRKDGTLLDISLTISPLRDAAGRVTGASKIARDITVAKRFEAALRVSEERYRSLVSIITDVPWTTDSRGAFVEPQPEWMEYTGQTFEDSRDFGWTDALHPDDRQDILDAWERALKSAAFYKSKGRLWNAATNQYRYFEAGATPLLDPDGTIREWIGTYTDVHERSLERSQRRFLFEVGEILQKGEDTEDLLYAVSKATGEHLHARRCLFNEIDLENDRETIRSDYCRGAESVKGVHKISDYSRITSAEMASGKTVVNRDSQLDDRTAADYERTYKVSGERAYVAVPLLRNGTWVASLWVSDDIPRDWTEHEIGLLETVAERTWMAVEKLRSEIALRESESHLMTVFSEAEVGLSELSLDGRFLAVNQELCRLLSRSREELLDLKIGDVTHDEDAPPGLEFVKQLLETGEPVSFEQRYVRPDGTIVWTANTLSLLKPRSQDRTILAVTADLTTRKLAEEGQKKSEELFSRFMQNLPGLAWIKDAEGRYVYANAAAAEAFNKPQEELYGKTDRQLFPLDVAAQFQENDQRALDDEGGIQSVETLEHTDGMPHHSIVNKFPILDPEGKAGLIGGMAIDITDRMRAEKALRDSEERYRTLFDLGPVAIYSCDASGLIQNFNRRAAELWGREPAPGDTDERFCGSFKMFRPDGTYMPHDQCPMAQVLNGEIPHLRDGEMQIERPDGSRVVVLVTIRPLKNEHSEITGAISCFYDITERKQAEVQLRSSEARYRRLFESSQDGILILDADNARIADANPYIGELLGYPPSDLIGKELWEIGLFKDIEESKTAVQELQEKKYIRYEDLPLETKTGRRADVEFISSVYEEGPYSVIQCNIRDTTERKKLQKIQEQTTQELRQLAANLSDADHRKNEFLAMLAHELRNPLAPISNAVKIMRMTGNGGAQAATEMMERQVGQLVRLVDDLLDVSRITQGKIELRRERIELASVVHHAVEAARPACESGGVDLRVTMSSEPIYLNGDQTRLAQVVGNLLNNACKFTDKGGTIDLIVKRESSDAVIRVLDSGIGISPDQLSHVFELFVQADTSLERSISGLGIGLTLVKNLVEMHEGTVTAASEGLGKGSEFIIRLPVLAEKAKERDTGSSSEAAEPTTGKLRILVVDDNEDSAESLALLLKISGHEVEMANDGMAAVEMAASFTPEVILLDIGLPKLNGYEAARAIRENPNGESINLIALTGWGQDEDRQRSKEAGFDSHMVKPVDHIELMKRLEEISEGKNGGS